MEISRNTKPKHQTPSSSYIPEWFLLEILFKLSSKSIFRFKCVSKQLLGLISDPSFVRDYISRASSKPLPLTLVNIHVFKALGDGEERFERNLSLESSTPCISKLFVTPPPSCMESSCKVLAISNGLCFCCWDYFKTYSIFNPITKQSILLPQTRDGMGMQQVGAMAFQAQVDQVGVVSYKVARLVFESGAPRTDLIVEEFSSKSYKWTSCRVQFPEPILCHDLTHPFSFKGKFHWVDVFSYHGSGCIISPYDPVHIINCPRTPYMSWCGEIVRGGGEHAIRCIEEDYDNDNEDCFINIWRLTDYEKGFWELDHKFALSDVLLPCADNRILNGSLLHDIALHPWEPDLLYFWAKAWGKSEEEQMEWMLVSYNVGSRKTRVSDTVPRKDDYGGISTSFLNTPFVLPPWPAIIPTSKLTCQTL